MWGLGFHQRTVEELVKSELKPGFPDGPPGRPRTWLGAAGLLALILAGLALVFVSDCSSQPEPTPSPAVASPSTT